MVKRLEYTKEFYDYVITLAYYTPLGVLTDMTHKFHNDVDNMSEYELDLFMYTIIGSKLYDFEKGLTPYETFLNNISVREKYTTYDQITYKQIYQHVVNLIDVVKNGKEIKELNEKE